MRVTTSDETHLCCSYRHFLNSTRLFWFLAPEVAPITAGRTITTTQWLQNALLSFLIHVSLTAASYNPTWISPYNGSLKTDGPMSSERYREFEYVNEEMQINLWFARIENKNGTIYMCSLRSCLSKMSTLFVLGSIKCRLTCWTMNCAETSYLSL